jgi:hydrogenase/urease accessory protein HupE
MKKVILSFLLLLSSLSVFAHRLNEYLEATTISLTRSKISLELRLTPGVAVAADILKAIDLNHDNQFSPGEQHAYLNALGSDLKLALDGRAMPIQVTSSSFPTAESITKGTGDIIIDFELPVSKTGTAHELQLTNAHYKAISVYLVNCLLPTDTGIAVTNQIRNANQSFYQLNFTIGKLQAGATSASLAQSNHWAIIKTYLLHGFRHILTGYDHLLFLCALVLGAAGFWDLIKIVTAFTIAHSITLTLATFGLAHLPETIVEPMIAGSIVFVAVQNIVRPKQAGGNIRLAVAFFFGLFHGLGFAGGLLELMHAMPTTLIWFAILGFSLGVEAGNQLILLPLYYVLQWFKNRRGYLKDESPVMAFQRYASGLVAMAGVYYLYMSFKI